MPSSVTAAHLLAAIQKGAPPATCASGPSQARSTYPHTTFGWLGETSWTATSSRRSTAYLSTAAHPAANASNMNHHTASISHSLDKPMLPIHYPRPRPDAQLREITDKGTAARRIQRPRRGDDDHALHPSPRWQDSNESAGDFSARRPVQTMALYGTTMTQLDAEQTDYLQGPHTANRAHKDYQEVRLREATVGSIGSWHLSRPGANRGESHLPANRRTTGAIASSTSTPHSTNPPTLSSHLPSSRSSSAFPPGWSTSPLASSDSGSDMSMATDLPLKTPGIVPSIIESPLASMLPLPSPILTSSAPVVMIDSKSVKLHYPRPIRLHQVLSALDKFEKIAWEEHQEDIAPVERAPEPVQGAFYWSGYHLDNLSQDAQESGSGCYVFDDALYESYEWLIGTA